MPPASTRTASTAKTARRGRNVRLTANAARTAPDMSDSDAPMPYSAHVRYMAKYATQGRRRAAPAARLPRTIRAMWAALRQHAGGSDSRPHARWSIASNGSRAPSSMRRCRLERSTDGGDMSRVPTASSLSTRTLAASSPLSARPPCEGPSSGRRSSWTVPHDEHTRSWPSTSMRGRRQHGGLPDGVMPRLRLHWGCRPGRGPTWARSAGAPRSTGRPSTRSRRTCRTCGSA